MKNVFIIVLLNLCIFTINAQEIRSLIEMFDDNVVFTQIDKNGIGGIYALRNNFSFKEDFTKLTMEIIPIKIWKNNDAITFLNFEISWNSRLFFPILSNIFGKYDFIGPVASINSFNQNLIYFFTSYSGYRYYYSNFVTYLDDFIETYMNANNMLLTFSFKLENVKRHDAYFKGVEFGYKNYRIGNNITNGIYITFNFEKKKIFEKLCIVIMI